MSAALHHQERIDPQADGAAFDARMASHGWVAFESLVPRDALLAIRRDIAAAVADCGRRQIAAGVEGAPDGNAHHAVGQYESFDRFLEAAWLCDYVARFFDGAPYILHAFNPATVSPAKRSFLHNIHRDVRTHAGDFRMHINMLMMADDFTLENGATYVLSGSHRMAEKPDEATFFRDADRLVFPAGTIVLFDSNLWHAAGQNTTQHTRGALTLSYSRPFIKQQIDFPRFLGLDYAAQLSPYMRQLLGYNAITPQSYEEWYAPRERRLYKAEQG